MDKRGEAYGQVSQEKDGHAATDSGGEGVLGGRLGQNIWTQASLPLALACFQMTPLWLLPRTCPGTAQTCLGTVQWRMAVPLMGACGGR